ncbi:hypothetical protein LguiA_016186 [Lonicera macranthoides]
MATSVEEDYIDMEVSSSSSTKYLCYSSTSSPPQSREFEFQMSTTISHEKETSNSPADELFYKGKLLPLHLPPRLQMVQKLLQNSTTPFITTSTAPSTNTSTPLESCNISPSESCRVSSELNPDEYFFEWSTELRGFICDHPKKCWSKKLKLIKQSSLCQKLKASRAYLKSLFSKSGCSDETCAKANCNSKYKEAKKKHPTIANVIKSIDKEVIIEDGVNNSHRRSFSGAIKRRYAAVCSSSSSASSGASSSCSSFSFNSSGFYELQFLKRSSSASSEIEGSIEAAIAHCKKSQHIFSSRNTLNETEHCSFSVSRVAASRDQGRPDVCSI